MSSPERPSSQARVYFEPARSYLPAAVALLALLAGMVTDLVVDGRGHLWGWLIAIVVVVGIYSAAIYLARSLRSITVTETQIFVGEQGLDRASIRSVDSVIEPTYPILGQTLHEGLPRGAKGLALHLADGGAMVIPTRQPERLAAVLRLEAAGPREAPQIRPAESADLDAIPDIDNRAETLFRVSRIKLPDIPVSVDELADAKAIFVADRPAVGYIRINEVDGLAHVGELAVIPGMMRRGIGTALLETACAWAREHGYPAITLTTFAEVSWNARFYAARGFEVVDATPGLAELRHWEGVVGLDAVGPRVVMRRTLTP